MAKKKASPKSTETTTVEPEPTNLATQAQVALEQRAELSETIERILNEREDLRRRARRDPNTISVWVSTVSLFVAIIGTGAALIYAVDAQRKANAALEERTRQDNRQSDISAIFAAMRTGQDEDGWRQAAANLVLLDDLGKIKLPEAFKIDLRIKAGSAHPGLPRNAAEGDAPEQLPDVNPPLGTVFGP